MEKKESSVKVFFTEWIPIILIAAILVFGLLENFHVTNFISDKPPATEQTVTK